MARVKAKNTKPEMGGALERYTRQVCATCCMTSVCPGGPTLCSPAVGA